MVKADENGGNKAGVDDDEQEDSSFSLASLHVQAMETTSFFTFESFSILSEDEVDFCYSYCGINFFHTSWRIPLKHLHGDLRRKDNKQAIDVALLSVGMSLLPWYWIGFPVPKVIIKAGYLDAKQVLFWEDLYRHCLVEFLLVNKLDVAAREIKLLVEGQLPLPVSSSASPPPPPAALDAALDQQQLHVLVPLGGGKDSIVVYECMRRQQQQQQKEKKEPMTISWCHVSDGYGEYDRNSYLKEVVAVSEAQMVYHIEHNLVDAKWEACRNHAYVLCGHPWAALVCFDTALLALLLDSEVAIAVGNERSANYGNGIVYQGIEVNHQYDKSWAFEKQACAYIKEYISPDIHYFSALQHVGELHIASYLARACDPRYLTVFVSCNEVEEGGPRWCHQCAKCLFVFLLFSAVLPAETVLQTVFEGYNLLEDVGLWPLLLELMGQGPNLMKPLECVGTQDEVIDALKLTASKWYSHDKEGSRMPALLEKALAALDMEDCGHGEREAGEGAGGPHQRAGLPMEENFPGWFKPSLTVATEEGEKGALRYRIKI